MLILILFKKVNYEIKSEEGPGQQDLELKLLLMGFEQERRNSTVEEELDSFAFI